jgi:hypothetical protein
VVVVVVVHDLPGRQVQRGEQIADTVTLVVVVRRST